MILLVKENFPWHLAHMQHRPQSQEYVLLYQFVFKWSHGIMTLALIKHCHTLKIIYSCQIFFQCLNDILSCHKKSLKYVIFGIKLFVLMQTTYQIHIWLSAKWQLILKTKMLVRYYLNSKCFMFKSIYFDQIMS